MRKLELLTVDVGPVGDPLNTENVGCLVEREKHTVITTAR